MARLEAQPGLLARRDETVLLRRLDGHQARQIELRGKEGTRDGKLPLIVCGRRLVRKARDAEMAAILPRFRSYSQPAKTRANSKLLYSRSLLMFL
jgi:hypothetical protein